MRKREDELKKRKKEETKIQSLDLIEDIKKIFRKLKPDFESYIIADSLIVEMIYLATVIGAEKELHRSPPYPGMPVPKHPASRKGCSLNAATNEIERIENAAGDLLVELKKMHSTTISALAQTGFYNFDLEDCLNKTIEELEKAKTKMKQWGKEYPEWKNARSGQPKKEIAFRIATILAEIYRDIMGRLPTIATDAYANGHPPRGEYFNLVKEIFNLLRIDASAGAMAKEARDILKKRKEIQDNPQEALIKCRAEMKNL